ncbi:MAG: DUF2007 domain-containing protein [Acidobacteria bacterium]|nr:DUF2007 domain-containing protein [Acidobacteriota bacterium]
MARTDSPDPVVVATFLDPMEAQLALAALEGSGIEAYLDQPNMAFIAQHYTRMSGGVRLFVRAHDAVRAISLLQNPDTSD